MSHTPEIVVPGDNIELHGNGDGTYEIHLINPDQKSNSCIGVIEGTHNTLTDIHIEEAYRGRGYGRETIELYIKQAKKANCDHMITTAVLHDAVAYVLRDNGFEPIEETLDEDAIIRRKYKKEFDSQ